MNTDASAINNEENSEAAQIERLLIANTQLQQQLASLTALYASLAQQLSDPLVSYGQEADRRILNARSIRSLYLREETRPGHAGLTEGTGLYALMIDELMVTGYLVPAQAVEELTQAEQTLRGALQPNA